jgi:hypothetical protein
MLRRGWPHSSTQTSNLEPGSNVSRLSNGLVPAIFLSAASLSPYSQKTFASRHSQGVKMGGC